jgi:hypothetical protein
MHWRELLSPHRPQSAAFTRWLRIAVGTVLTGAIAAFCWQQAQIVHMEYVPANGTFQTFNPQRRLEAGQLPGRDFQAYLGLGPTWVVRLATFATGHTFADVLKAANLAAGAAFLLSMLLLGRLCGLRWPASLAALVALMSLGFAESNAWLAERLYINLPATFYQVYRPANSNLGLRAAAAFLAAGTIFLAAPWMAQATLRRRVLVAGMAAGTGLVWSNDYGVPTFAAICAVWGLMQPAGRHRWMRLGATPAIAGIGLTTAAVLATLLTGFGPLCWFSYNLGVAADQFWYFPGDKICRLADLPFGPMEATALAVLAYLSRRVLRGTSSRGDAPLVQLLASTLAASYLSAAGGAKSLHYTLPMQCVLLYAAPYCAWLVFDLDSLAVWCKRSLVAASGFGLAAWLGYELVQDLPRLNSPTTPSPAATIEVPELGGCLPRDYDGPVAIGREWRARPGLTVFSTYSTGIETIAGVFQPTGHDYIIHALGDRERRRYVQTLVDGRPDYVVTLRDDYPTRPSWWNWEGWARRANWDFYRELFVRYRPVEETIYCTVWEPRPAPIEPSPVEPLVQVTPLADHAIELRIALPTDPALTPGVHYVELEVDARAEWKSGRWLAGALRQYAFVQSDRPFVSGKIDQFGIPMNRGPVRFPIEVEPGGEAKATLHLQPAEVSRLVVRSCSARHIIGRVAIDNAKPARLRPSSLCDANWTNGVWTQHASAAAFFVSDASLLRRIAPGDRLRFARSGERTIQRIDGDQVWLEGPSLDPHGDGYPHAVEVLD